MGHSKWIRLVVTASLGLAAWTAHAAPIPVDLSITGFASFDATFSVNPEGDIVTQGGTLTRIAGGTTTTATLIGDVATGVTGDNPLAGQLSATGDGFGVSLNGSGEYDSETPAVIAKTFGDLGMSLLNNSATVTYTIVLSYHYEATANADGNEGEDAYGLADVRLANATTASDVGGTVLQSDLLLGDSIDGEPIPPVAFGEALSGSNTIVFLVTLAPGAQVDLGDDGYELRIAGGASDPGTSFSTSGALMLTVDEIRSSEPPTPTPTPGTLLLLAPALLALGWSRQRQIKSDEARNSIR